MPSETERARGTLVGRVAVTTSVAVALAVALAATTTGLLTDRFVLASEDRHLLDAAAILARELGEGVASERAHIADEEAQELRASGVRIALFDGALRKGGDPTIAAPHDVGCSTFHDRTGPTRACAVRTRHGTVVTATSLEHLAAQRRAFVLAALISALVAALIAALASRRGAAWSLRPLTRLQYAVRAFSPHAPSWEALETISAPAEIDALRSALVDLIRRLDEAVGQSRRFAADAAHELRTPLTALRAELELELEASTVPSTQAALSRAAAHLGSLQRLVERLLILASPQPGDLPREAVALIDVLAELRVALPQAARARVELVEGAEGTVRGDPALLATLLGNGIDNALKFSAGPVRVRLSEDAHEVLVEIEDEGPGLPPEEVERVFEPFYRSAQARSSAIGGHGIGLALIAHVTQAHGGRVCFEPVARGARLTIRLPAWRAPAKPEEA